MFWAILAVVAIFGIYLVSFALCRSAARNDKLDRLMANRFSAYVLGAIMLAWWGFSFGRALGVW